MCLCFVSVPFDDDPNGSAHNSQWLLSSNQFASELGVDKILSTVKTVIL